ncbi:putative 4-hydroxy-4-methyl-2-oxoglutarate aldolase 3 [Juglans microcarpa x Juglans regia]|uniref:putative 4-hydroxy-4-methyl-2-oxoglutarate aldolase 3 n=1 Tax=Juglans microcarpa x Juglans regia TaxID=2249226 RepID=UPI001B7F251E|nr:putative 4-hydroxy-4-methyl-2-oxoglutarate aldolase 3 [Juglans microcarpa x Juglans regia]
MTTPWWSPYLSPTSPLAKSSSTTEALRTYCSGKLSSKWGKRRTFSGTIVTLKLFEDNQLVMDLLETTRGEGRVLVIDGGGSRRRAMMGGLLSLQLAQDMGWAAIVVNGCIRDVEEINGCDIGVRALASMPVRSNKEGIGEKHVPVYVAGTLIRDGEWLYADSDGIAVSKYELSI